MKIDTETVPENSVIETDICIAGAGVAGIALAREFVNEKYQVCVLESGGMQPDRATQSMYWGENTGYPYYPLDTARIRCFGGTSHRWYIDIRNKEFGVRLHPFERIDFEKRDEVPYSGWPFNKSYLDPYYERAQSICQIGPYSYDVEDWEDHETPHIPFKGSRVKTTMFQFGPSSAFKNDYRDELIQAGNIQVYLNANVREIETNENARLVKRLNVATSNGKRFQVSAKLFILAMGGIEIPRLLLLSNKVQKNGLGNQNDNVGRFFMEHIHIYSGKYIPSTPDFIHSASLYKIHRVNNVPVMGKLILSEDVLRQEKLLNYCVSILPRLWDYDHWQLPHNERLKSIDSLKELGASFSKGLIPDGFNDHIKNIITDADNISIKACRRMGMKFNRIFENFKMPKKYGVFQLDHMTEQAPNPESRVTLAEECDDFGQRRVCLDWRLSSIDKHTILRAQEILDEELRRAGLGSVIIEHDENNFPVCNGGWHHMGTTRIHNSPTEGVVDPDCKVHDIGNLFIAGPSVFPTGGYANPTLTFIALAVRLADHIKNHMNKL